MLVKCGILLVLNIHACQLYYFVHFIDLKCTLCLLWSPRMYLWSGTYTSCVIIIVVVVVVVIVTMMCLK